MRYQQSKYQHYFIKKSQQTTSQQMTNNQYLVNQLQTISQKQVPYLTPDSKYLEINNYPFSMKRSPQILDQKDLIIQNLQVQLSESTRTVEDISLVQSQLQNLQHKYSLLQNQHLNSKCNIHSKVEASEKTISNLKGEILILETQLKEKQMILSDYQHENTSIKDQKIARDNQAEILRYETEGLKSDGEALIHQSGKLDATRLVYDNQLREIQKDLIQLEQTKISITQKISNSQRQKQSSKIEAQRLSTILRNYENQNIRLNQQLRDLQNEQKNFLRQTGILKEQLISQQLLQTQLQNRLTKVRNQVDMTQGRAKQQKERLKETTVMIRNKVVFKESLQSNIQNQLKEKNFLLGKNGQIAQINDRLKSDLSLCESHLNNLKVNIQAQKQLLSRLNQEDQKIVQIIQNRQASKDNKNNYKLSVSRATGFNY